MKIDRVSVFPIRIKRREELKASTFTYKDYAAVIVKVESDGLSGFGEAMSRCDPIILAELCKYLSKDIIGKNPNPIRLFNSILSGLAVRGHTRGLEVEALSGIEIAMWDLVGKLRRKSVCELLGKKRRKEFKVVSGSVDKINYEERIKRLKSLSIDLFKLKIGFGLKNDIELLNKVVKVSGSMRIVADSNCAYNLKDAITFSKLASKLPIEWFEEPILPEDIVGYRELKRRSKLKIGAGESWFLSDLKLGINNKLVDVLEPSVSRCGGIKVLFDSATACSKKGIDFCPMNGSNSSISLAASLNICSATNFGMVELDPFDNPLYGITPGFPNIKQGKVDLPKGYGLGVDVDEKYMRKISLKIIN